jgi:hypothetical protein
MSIIPRVANPYDDPVGHADFAELECLYTDDGNVSLGDLARALQRGTDLNPKLKSDVGDDFATNRAEEAFSELADRISHCGDAKDLYPYELSKDGRLVQFKPTLEAEHGLPPVSWSTSNGRPLGRAKYKHVFVSVYSD